MQAHSDHRRTPLATRFSTRIRYKVLAAALLVVIIIAGIGLIGFGYITAVTRSVAVTTQQTSPLLYSALAASEATHRIISAGRDTERICEMEEDTDSGISRWGSELAAIDRLHHAARSAGLIEHATKVIAASGALDGTLSNISAVCRVQQSTLATLKRQEREAVYNIDQYVTAVNGLVLALDGEMAANEDRAKAALQTDRGAEPGNVDLKRLLSRTLFDTWPTVRSLYKLREQAIRMKDLIAGRGEAYSFDDLESKAAIRAEILDALKVLTYQVAPRLRALGHDVHTDNMTTAFQNMESDVKGISGFEDTQRQYLRISADADLMETSLSEVENRLSTVMKDLEDEARARDTTAQAAMKATTGEAMLVLGLLAGLSGIGTLFGALRFTDRLTSPLELLTAHTRRLQETQDFRVGLPADLERRPDEIGRLASSFTDMVEALGIARRRLVAESRAEIKIQFERLKAAIEGIPQGIYLVGPDNSLLLSNGRFAELYALKKDQLQFGTSGDAVAAACRANGAGVAIEVLEAPQSGAGEQLVRQSIQTLEDGRTMVVTMAPTSDGGAVFVHEDITERRRTEARIAHLAHHDALTGLANRILFRDQANESLARRGAEDAVAVLYIDLDHFKAVNDTLGHPVGDRLLIFASKRLCSCLREYDHVARLGGDEFAVVLNGNPSRREVDALADEIISSVSQPYEIDDQQVVIGVSIGIAMAPDDGEDADRLMKGADMALYRAKKDGRNMHCFFEPGMDAKMQERRVLEMALRKAIIEEGLEVHYQPLVNIATNNVEEFEALVRWSDPERGPISPDVFIPLAEETGLIGELSQWVLRRACEDAMSWPNNVRVAVNISPLQFRTRTLVLNVISALEASGLSPDRLELEITEGVLLHDTKATLATLKQLQDLGVRIAMDDFGTGYSSLSYLRKFNFNKVKIDRSFVSELDKTKDSRAIIRAVSGLCTTLGIEITAEGVETERQLKTLREEGCTQVQGYLLGRPGPASTVKSYFSAVELGGYPRAHRR